MADTLVDRFWSKVRIGDAHMCWEWQASKTPTGYGTFRVNTTRRACAHRVAYEMSVGPIPTGLEIDHLCRNRGCCNPAHLEPVTRQENVSRSTLVTAPWNAAGVAAAAEARRAKERCSHGHEFTPANTRRAGDRRICRACGRLHSAAHRARKRGESDR